ncbi:endopeptidase [Enterobacterales bacterium CwR94]|nr:endopeptidase [Enterobacterales bacterium CwR94]
MRSLISIIMLASLSLCFNVAVASPQTAAKPKQHKVEKRVVRDDDRRKRRTATTKTIKKTKTTTQAKKKAPSKSAIAALQKQRLKKTAGNTSERMRLTSLRSTKKNKSITLTRKQIEKASLRKRLGRSGNKALEMDIAERSAPIRMNPAHHARYQKARQTAMNKLMGQLGKPYLWGGSSPDTGFDCSGLVWYAYKDLLKSRMPRTANEQFQFRDAAPVRKEKLERGDLVFFRINGRGAADHVGVYLGNGKFIQSPRTGKDIQISQLADNYWQKHYVGARRVMTPQNVKSAL